MKHFLFVFQFALLPLIFLYNLSSIPKPFLFPVLWVWAFVNFVYLIRSVSPIKFFKAVSGLDQNLKPKVFFSELKIILLRFVALLSLIHI